MSNPAHHLPTAVAFVNSSVPGEGICLSLYYFSPMSPHVKREGRDQAGIKYFKNTTLNLI
jgi:hypothetical protein